MKQEKSDQVTNNPKDDSTSNQKQEAPKSPKKFQISYVIIIIGIIMVAAIIIQASWLGINPFKSEATKQETTNNYSNIVDEEEKFEDTNDDSQDVMPTEPSESRVDEDINQPTNNQVESEHNITKQPEQDGNNLRNSNNDQSNQQPNVLNTENTEKSSKLKMDVTLINNYRLILKHTAALDLDYTTQTMFNYHLNELEKLLANFDYLMNYLQSLKKFNNSLQNTQKAGEIVTIFNNDFANNLAKKFISIEKLPPKPIEQSINYLDASNHLKELKKYIFSNKFLRQYLGVRNND